MKNGSNPENYQKIWSTIRLQTSKLVDFFGNTRNFPFYYRLSRSAVSIKNHVFFSMRTNLQLWISAPRLKSLSQTVSFDEHRTSFELCCKLKPNYYVQPQIYNIRVVFCFILFLQIVFFSSHFSRVYSVDALTGVKTLVWLLWPSTWQTKPRSIKPTVIVAYTGQLLFFLSAEKEDENNNNNNNNKINK